MSEQSERMMLLLKELAVLNKQDKANSDKRQPKNKPGALAAHRKRRRELKREMLQLAEEKKKSSSKSKRTTA